MKKISTVLLLLFCIACNNSQSDIPNETTPQSEIYIPSSQSASVQTNTSTPPSPIFQKPPPSSMPNSATNTPDKTLESFIEQCKGTVLDHPLCVYAPNSFQLYLEFGNGTIPNKDDQRAKLWQYVWEQESVVAILAHDFLGGAYFYRLSQNSHIYLIWGDGHVENYQISTIDRWKDAGSWLAFIPWDGGNVLADIDLYRKYYKGGISHNKIIFQTCIDTNAGITFFVGTRVP